jgi:hypothetical protein
MNNIDYENMTHQYFYENFFLIDGKKPPLLTEFDKQLLAAFDEQLKNGGNLIWRKSRGGYKLAKCAEEKAIRAEARLRKPNLKQ